MAPEASTWRILRLHSEVSKTSWCRNEGWWRLNFKKNARYDAWEALFQVLHEVEAPRFFCLLSITTVMRDSVEGDRRRSKVPEIYRTAATSRLRSLDLPTASQIVMFSLEKIFVGFIDQLSQQHSHGVGLIGVRSRRIQRSLRLIDAAQGGCWTAPCSPAVPAFGEITSGQPGALVRRDACYNLPNHHLSSVQSWRDSPLLPEH